MKLRSFFFAMLAVPAQFAMAQVAPTYDLTGVWEYSGGGTIQIFQRDSRLTVLFVGPDYAHRFQANYADATSASGLQVRVTRATGCTTHTTQTIVAVSADQIDARGTVLDSNCDLVRGQQIGGTLWRTF
jgi:hypothetical protein